MLLTDGQIMQAVQRGDIAITPFDQRCVQPASVDLHLGNEIREYMLYNNGTFLGDLDPVKGITEHDTRAIPFVKGVNRYQLRPGAFILATTTEHVTLGPQVAARIEGKSTPGRFGLAVHVTAGFVDPGFSGQLTLEMTNFNSRVILLYPGMRIAQLGFEWLSEPVQRPYGHPDLGSHYQGQSGARAPSSLS
jgi:dCTP deaminase